MTKNEFKQALDRAENLIDEVNDILDKIIHEASFSQNEEDVEDLRDALFDMYPTGWSKQANEIFDEYYNFFDNDFTGQT